MPSLRPGLALTRLAALLLPALAQAADVAPAVVGIGQLSGTQSYVSGLNDLGQAVGAANLTGDKTYHAVLFSAGQLVDLGTLGGANSRADAINNLGQIVGSSLTVNGKFNATLFSATAAPVDLGNLDPADIHSSGNVGTFATAINDSGQVVGWGRAQPLSTSVGGLPVGYRPYRAFITDTTGKGLTDLGAPTAGDGAYAFAINAGGQAVGELDTAGASTAALFANGTATSLGALVPGAISSAYGINNLGQVVGSSYLVPNDVQSPTHAFLYSNGVMSDLGVLAGATGTEANALNDHGLIVGDASFADGSSRAVAWVNGHIVDLSGLGGAGWALTYAGSVNQLNQIGGSGLHNGVSEGFILTPRPAWQGGNGSWSDASRWSYSILGVTGTLPEFVHDVLIAPTTSATITGSSNASVRSLTVQGAAGQRVTFDLAGGYTSTTAGTLVGANAVLTGSGQLDGGLTVQTGGVLQVTGGQSLLLSGGATVVQGSARLLGGGGSASLTALTPLTVAAGGRMNLQGANLNALGGLLVQGQLTGVGGGGNSLYGAVRVDTGGQLIVAGNGGTAFYDAVEVRTGAELRVSTGAAASFFGPVQLRTGAQLTGAGLRDYEAGLSVGASPGYAFEAGDVSFGAGNVYTAEIGGATACTAACATDAALKDGSYDQYTVGGHLTLGGQLRLVSWNSFVAQAGMHFTLLDWGGLSGSFSSIDASGLLLAPGTALDTSRLYTDGVIGVTAVPEPAAWALLLAGLAGLGVLRRRPGRTG